MRHENLYLADMIEAADFVAEFISGTDFDGFERSELIRSAVALKLATIGEAASRVSEDLRRSHPEVPWPQIVAFRNILIHGYFGIEWEIVWNAACYRCPELRAQIAAILALTDLNPGSDR